MKRTLIGGVVLGALLLCACSTTTPTTSTNTIEISQQETTSKQETTTQQQETTSQEAPTPESYGLGDVIQTKNCTLKVLELNTLESDNMFAEPDDGNEFIECVIEIENTSNSEMTISSLMSLTSYVDGYSIDEDFTARMATKKSSLDGTIAPGKKLLGSACYQVPTDWQELEIDFNDSLFSNDPIKIVVHND